ncbi:hypothetical protein [[Phormidium] sp. ETS-05]|nr:hypothetical protein [[Phormidium] sp. ETS-05]
MASDKGQVTFDQGQLTINTARFGQNRQVAVPFGIFGCPAYA